MMMNLYEGGAAIANSNPVLKDDVADIVKQARDRIPPEIAKGIQVDIGSAGYKVRSGDIDLMVEASDVVDYFGTQKAKDPVLAAKQAFKQYFIEQGIESNLKGRNVHIGIPYMSKTGGRGLAQVDVMVIHDAAVVAPWHQHGPRGMYDQPDFMGNEIFVLISSLAKFKNLKFDPFSANLTDRTTGEVVGRTRKQVAKILLNPNARESDLDSVRTIMAALAKDPDREGKLAQARQDAARGILRLPETAQVGTAAWFRELAERIR